MAEVGREKHHAPKDIADEVLQGYPAFGYPAVEITQSHEIPEDARWDDFKEETFDESPDTWETAAPESLYSDLELELINEIAHLKGRVLLLEEALRLANTP